MEKTSGDGDKPTWLSHLVSLPYAKQLLGEVAAARDNPVRWADGSPGTILMDGQVQSQVGEPNGNGVRQVHVKYFSDATVTTGSEPPVPVQAFEWTFAVDKDGRPVQGIADNDFKFRFVPQPRPPEPPRKPSETPPSKGSAATSPRKSMPKTPERRPTHGTGEPPGLDLRSPRRMDSVAKGLTFEDHLAAAAAEREKMANAGAASWQTVPLRGIVDAITEGGAGADLDGAAKQLVARAAKEDKAAQDALLEVYGARGMTLADVKRAYITDAAYKLCRDALDNGEGFSTTVGYLGAIGAGRQSNPDPSTADAIAAAINSTMDEVPLQYPLRVLDPTRENESSELEAAMGRWKDRWPGKEGKALQPAQGVGVATVMTRGEQATLNPKLSVELESHRDQVQKQGPGACRTLWIKQTDDSVASMPLVIANVNGKVEAHLLTAGHDDWSVVSISKVVAANGKFAKACVPRILGLPPSQQPAATWAWLEKVNELAKGGLKSGLAPHLDTFTPPTDGPARDFESLTQSAQRLRSLNTRGPVAIMTTPDVVNPGLQQMFAQAKEEVENKNNADGTRRAIVINSGMKTYPHWMALVIVKEKGKAHAYLLDSNGGNNHSSPTLRKTITAALKAAGISNVTERSPALQGSEDSAPHMTNSCATWCMKWLNEVNDAEPSGERDALDQDMKAFVNDWLKASPSDQQAGVIAERAAMLQSRTGQKSPVSAGAHFAADPGLFRRVDIDAHIASILGTAAKRQPINDATWAALRSALKGQTNAISVSVANGLKSNALDAGELRAYFEGRIRSANRSAEEAAVLAALVAAPKSAAAKQEPTPPGHARNDSEALPPPKDPPPDEGGEWEAPFHTRQRSDNNNIPPPPPERVSAVVTRILKSIQDGKAPDADEWRRLKLAGEGTQRLPLAIKSLLVATTRGIYTVSTESLLAAQRHFSKGAGSTDEEVLMGHALMGQAVNDELSNRNAKAGRQSVHRSAAAARGTPPKTPPQTPQQSPEQSPEQTPLQPTVLVSQFSAVKDIPLPPPPK